VPRLILNTNTPINLPYLLSSQHQLNIRTSSTFRSSHISTSTQLSTSAQHSASATMSTSTRLPARTRHSASVTASTSTQLSTRTQHSASVTTSASTRSTATTFSNRVSRLNCYGVSRCYPPFLTKRLFQPPPPASHTGAYSISRRGAGFQYHFRLFTSLSPAGILQTTCQDGQISVSHYISSCYDEPPGKGHPGNWVK
jgi:hypothetical protein